MPAVRVMLVCTDCRKKMRGSQGDEARQCCEKCGGQLRVVRYGPAKRKAR